MCVRPHFYVFPKSAVSYGLLYSFDLGHGYVEIVFSQKELSFVLRHFEGMSIAEIGRLLNLDISAAKHSVFRAVQKMRRALAPIVSQPE